MSDNELLLDYTRFVDEVTSDASKDSESFMEALDIIEETSSVPQNDYSQLHWVSVQKVVSLLRWSRSVSSKGNLWMSILCIILNVN